MTPLTHLSESILRGDMIRQLSRSPLMTTSEFFCGSALTVQSSSSMLVIMRECTGNKLGAKTEKQIEGNLLGGE